MPGPELLTAWLLLASPPPAQPAHHRKGAMTRPGPTRLDPAIGPPQRPDRPGWATELIRIDLRPDHYQLTVQGEYRRVPLDGIEAALLALPVSAWPLGRQLALGGPGPATEEDHRRIDQNEQALLPILQRLGIEVLMLPR